MLRIPKSLVQFASSSPALTHHSCLSLIPILNIVHKRFASTPAVSNVQVQKFEKKVGKIQKKFGIKGTSKFLSLEREKWHLRQKQKREDTQQKIPGINREFRAITPDKEIVNYIAAHKLGRRRPERVKKETRVMQYKKEYIPKLKFVGAAKKKASFLPTDQNMLEVAFVGRSNVGKSTLINVFTSSGVARASDTPGETRSINWYKWAGKMYIVDLPGYGFSYSSLEQKQAWTDLMKEYVTNRKTLRRVMVLLDARHGVKPSDLEMIELLNTAKKKFQIVLTKVDRVTPPDLARQCTIVSKQTKKYKYLVGPVLMVSAKKNTGMERLRSDVERFMRKTESPQTETTQTTNTNAKNEPKPTKTTSQPTKKDSQKTKNDTISKAEEAEISNTENTTNQPTTKPTLKEMWRRDEERRKKMLERKQIEQNEQEYKQPEVERDEEGKVFKPHQRYRRGVPRKKTKR